MKIRNLLTGAVFDAQVTTEHGRSSYGQGAVVVNADVIDPVGIEIVQVSEAERALLPPWWLTLVAQS